MSRISDSLPSDHHASLKKVGQLSENVRSILALIDRYVELVVREPGNDDAMIRKLAVECQQARRDLVDALRRMDSQPARVPFCTVCGQRLDADHGPGCRFDG